MFDDYLTIAAVLFELGTVAAVSGSVLFGAPIGRHKGVVVAGAITPAVVYMADIAYAQMTRPALGNMASAGWLMGLVAFALLLLGGVAVSWDCSRPDKFRHRITDMHTRLCVIC